MTDKEFDERVRQLCSGITPEPVPDIWGGIEERLVRKRRIVMWRRAGMMTAAAAVIAAGFILTHQDTVSTPVVSVTDVKPLLSQSPESAFPTSADVSGVEEKPAVIGKTAAVVPGVNNEDSAVIVPEDVVSSVPSASESAEEVRETAKETAKDVDTYSQTDYLAFADKEPVRSRNVALTVSSDFYTIYGNGNVNFTSKSMSGGSSGTGAPAVKPLAGSSPSHDLPISAGIGVQYGFGQANSYGQHRFGIGLGVEYTGLKSSYQALVSKEFLGKYGQGSEQASVTQTVHYLGVPVSFYVNILTTDKLFFYASAGGALEKGLQLKYRFTDMSGVVSNKSLSVSGLQWSANLGLGFEYRFIPIMGVYVDPRLTYYFDCDQPYSIREEQRLQLNLGLGFRFHF